MLIFRGVTDSGLHLEPHDQLKGAEGIKDYTQGVPSIHPSSIQKNTLVRCLFLGPSKYTHTKQVSLYYDTNPNHGENAAIHGKIPQKYHSFASSLGPKKPGKFCLILAKHTGKKPALGIQLVLSRLGLVFPSRRRSRSHNFWATTSPEAPRNNAHPRQTAGLYRGLLKPLVFP